MTPYRPDPRLGQLVSQHRHNLTYPVIVSLVALGLIVGGIYVAVYAQPLAGALVALGAAAIAALYVFSQARQRLYLHEQGICLAKGEKTQVVLWQDIAKVSVTYSYHAHPDTIIDISFRQHTGPRLVLRMNWTGRKELARHLWPIIQNEGKGDA